MALHSNAVSRTFEERRPVHRGSVVFHADRAMSERAYAGACLAVAQQALPESRGR